jgi:GT2 family glycosyltransferase
MTVGTMPAFGRAACSIQAQTVLYDSTFSDLRRTVEALARAVEIAMAQGAVGKAVLRLGDCSATPMLDQDLLTTLDQVAHGTMRIHYDFFAANLGSAGGHNRLAGIADEGTDFIWIQNPDVIVSPRLFLMVLEPFARPGVGQVEAKQLPAEHPKDYDPKTGETDWTTGACVMTPASLFRQVNGYDALTFFLYCDDVDLAFRIREQGYCIVFQPAAICFHDKRLAKNGAWQPTRAEQYYSAEAALMMAHKWSYPALLEEILGLFRYSSDADLQEAARVYSDREHAGTLPAPRDAAHRVARFMPPFYSKHRYVF